MAMVHRVTEPEVLIRYGVIEPDTLDPLFYTVRIVYAGIRSSYLTMSAPAWFFLVVTGLLFLLFGVLMPLTTMVLLLIWPDAASSSWIFSIVMAEILVAWIGVIQSKERGMLMDTRSGNFTDIAISDSGLRLLCRKQYSIHEIRRLEWKSITGVYLDERSESKLKPKSKELCLILRDDQNRETAIKVNLIRSIEERRILVDMIKDKARLALNDTDISSIARVGQMNDLAFTRLWSRALTDHAPRLCSTVLPSNSALQDGRFMITKQIGAGGQGSVYAAEMMDIPGQIQNVVLKEYILPDVEHQIDRQRAIEQFEREVSVLNKLESPQIVHLIDAFVEDHRAYLVLDFVDGVSLKELVARKGALPAVKVAELAIQMCQALEYLHTLTPPMVHLDFTPENLMLKNDNQLMVVDFNTASDVNLSKTSIVIGKQSYMAPEQYRGKVQPSCDIFAAGVTMYYLLTALEPEALTNLRIADGNDAMQSLGRIVSKATNLEESERYQTTAEMRQDIELFLRESGAGDRREEHERKETGVC
jgi:tRNA A-37 threonylcarbamoyl transferase component Bud32